MNRDILPELLAAMIIKNGYIGKPYLPSNGTEGEMFMEAYCYYCEKDNAYQNGIGDSCDILVKTLCLLAVKEEYPKEWIYNKHGQPTCTAFVELIGNNEEVVNDNQLNLFKGGN